MNSEQFVQENKYISWDFAFDKTQSKINEMTSYIKSYAGITIKLCDYFTGINTHRGKQYFNAIVGRDVYTAIDKLSRINVKATPNGVDRIAIYFRD